MTVEKKQRSRKFDDLKGTLRRAEGVLELVLLAVTYYMVWRNIYDGSLFPTYYGNGKYVLTLVYGLIIVILFILCDCFKFGHLKLSDVIISQWISMILVNIITYFQLCLIANVMISFIPIVLLSGLDFVICFCCCYVFSVIYHHIYVPRNMVMVYGTDNAVNLKFKMDTRTDKYRITNMISIAEGIDKIKSEIYRHDAVILNDIPAEMRNDIMKDCYERGIRTYLVPKISDIITRGAQDITLFDTPLLLVKGKGLTREQQLIKRIFDIVLCLIAMIPGAPIMAAVAIAIKLDDHGPVFYRQKRVTMDGKTFDILKFRSMIVNAEKLGESIPATDKDPRITRVGNFIRATRIDELPQILNILKGDMSIVGPRPERVEHVVKYTRDIPEFAFRQKVKGGLTGYAQIYGKYNTSAYDKLRLDLIYIENYSLMLDIKLIFMTLRILFKKESTEGFDQATAIEKKKEEFLEKKQEELLEEKEEKK